MNVWVVQSDIAWKDVEENHRRVGALLESCDVEPGDLIVLPEMFATGFSMDVDAVAEVPGESTEAFLAGLAASRRATVVGGCATQAGRRGGRGRNEAVVFGPAGAEIGRFAKLHPFSFVGEDRVYEPGPGVRLFRWGEFTVAPFICYDLRFPEVFRSAVRNGADLLVVIANWPDPRAAHWSTLLRARAIENQAYVVGVNRCGADPKHRYAGASAIIDPWGNSLVEAGEEQTVIHARPDAQALRNYRREFPALTDARESPEGVEFMSGRGSDGV